jgi:hypothetical protein
MFRQIPLMLYLFLLPIYGAAGLGQNASIPDTQKGDSNPEAHKIKQRAELFLTSCIQRDWKKATTYLSSTSPLVLSDTHTAAKDWLVGRLKKFEIWEIEGEDYSSAVVVHGCARLSGRGHGNFEFLMALVPDREERKIYHFEIVHEGVDLDPVKCSFRK